MTQNINTHRQTSQHGDIRELTAHEAQAVSGALSVRPDQIAGLAKLFGSTGGGTATTGLILQPRPITGLPQPY